LPIGLNLRGIVAPTEASRSMPLDGIGKGRARLAYASGAIEWHKVAADLPTHPARSYRVWPMPGGPLDLSILAIPSLLMVSVP
jgi:hypothetical protein